MDGKIDFLLQTNNNFGGNVRTVTESFNKIEGTYIGPTAVKGFNFLNAQKTSCSYQVYKYQ